MAEIVTLTVGELMRVLGIQERSAPVMIVIEKDCREIIGLEVERDEHGKAVRVILVGSKATC